MCFKKIARNARSNTATFSGSLLKLTWDSHRGDSSILAIDILGASIDNTKKSSNRGKHFTIHTTHRKLRLVAGSSKEALWFVTGFKGLISEVQNMQIRRRTGERDSVFDVGAYFFS